METWPIPSEDNSGERRKVEEKRLEEGKSGNWCPPRVGRCARLTRTVKSPPAPFWTALAIRIERQCQGQGRPSPPSLRVLALPSLIPHPRSLFLFRGTHTHTRAFHLLSLRRAADRGNSANTDGQRCFFANFTRISVGFSKFLER